MLGRRMTARPGGQGGSGGWDSDNANSCDGLANTKMLAAVPDKAMLILLTFPETLTGLLA